MRDQLRIGSGLSWIAAWLLVLGAVVLALAFDRAGWTWWVGMLLLLPLIGLTAWRADEKGGGSDPYYNAGDGGPWGPPA